jgi:transposase
MEQYAGIDVSLEFSSVCVVDAAGKIIREARVVSEPSSLIAWFAALGMDVARIGLEAGPLSQWLYAEMKTAGLAVELLETRHVRDAFKAMPVKTDRKSLPSGRRSRTRGMRAVSPSSCGSAGFARFTASRCQHKKYARC